MEKTYHELEYHHSGGQLTDFDLQFFYDIEERQAHVFLLREAAENQGPHLHTTRAQIAREWCEKFGFRPEQLLWYEQEQNGTLRRHAFERILDDPGPRSTPTPRVEHLTDAPDRGVLRLRELHAQQATTDEILKLVGRDRHGQEHSLTFPESQQPDRSREEQAFEQQRRQQSL